MRAFTNAGLPLYEAVSDIWEFVGMLASVSPAPATPIHTHLPSAQIVPPSQFCLQID